MQDKVIPVYLCPADQGNAVPFAGYTHNPGPWGRGNYAANAGPGWWQMSLDGASYAETYGLTGPVFGINFGSVFFRIPDGVSATVMFNEVRIGVNDLDPRGVWAMGYPGASITAANAIGDCTTPNDANEGSDDIQGCPDFYYPASALAITWAAPPGSPTSVGPAGSAGSRHPGGVNVCFCDGSVRFVSDFVEQGIWFQLLSSNDGGVPSYIGD